MTQVHVYSSHAVLLLDINFLLSSAVQHRTPSLFYGGGHWSIKLLETLQNSVSLSVCPTGAWVCCSRWTRATSWTWSTSQSASSPSPSPAVWRSRATPPTCARSPPCCAPNTATTTWYSSLCVFSSGKCGGPTPRRNESFPDQPFVSWSLSQSSTTEALCNVFKLFYVSRSGVAALWSTGGGGCWNNNRIPHLLKLTFRFLYWQAVPQL